MSCKLLLFKCFLNVSRAVNIDFYVKDIIKFKWETTDNPIKDKSEFKELTLREKVELILAICEYRLDTEDVLDQLKVCMLFLHGTGMHFVDCIKTKCVYNFCQLPLLINYHLHFCKNSMDALLRFLLHARSS